MGISRMSGSTYASRRSALNRPEGDFYATPASLAWSLLDNVEIPLIKAWEKKKRFLSKPAPKPVFVDPAVGDGALLRAFEARGFLGRGSDLYPAEGYLHRDFLEHPIGFNPSREILCFNPPFSLFDEFITRAKEIAPYFITLGRVNFFGTHGRNRDGLWKNLKSVHVFDRMVDYRTPARDDGHFHLGALVTCWMVFDRTWTKPYWETSLLDVQDYATLGPFKEDA